MVKNVVNSMVCFIFDIDLVFKFLFILCSVENCIYGFKLNSVLCVFFNVRSCMCLYLVVMLVNK